MSVRVRPPSFSVSKKFEKIGRVNQCEPFFFQLQVKRKAFRTEILLLNAFPESSYRRPIPTVTVEKPMSDLFCGHVLTDPLEHIDDKFVSPFLAVAELTKPVFPQNSSTGFDEFQLVGIWKLGGIS